MPLVKPPVLHSQIIQFPCSKSFTWPIDTPQGACPRLTLKTRPVLFSHGSIEICLMSKNQIQIPDDGGNRCSIDRFPHDHLICDAMDQSRFFRNRDGRLAQPGVEVLAADYRYLQRVFGEDGPRLFRGAGRIVAVG